MLSIIISTYQPHYYNALEKNIAETCDVEYEMIKIDNPGKMGICEAYNKGAEKARFPYLLFLHEDVMFHTQAWGEKLISQLQNPECGIVGVAGSNYVPKAPCGWNVDVTYNAINILQGEKNNESQLCHAFPNDVKPFPAFAIDGVFMAISTSNFLKIKFDEKITGFHGYDLDFSLRCARNKRNFITDEILIEHFSKGNPDRVWFENNIAIRRKNGSRFNSIKDKNIELKVFLQFLRTAIDYNGVSFRTFINSLQFWPVRVLNISQNIKILKQYFKYFYYRKDFKKALTQSNHEK